MKNRTSELVRLAFSGRHDNLSTIVITQKITAISQSFRENIAMLVTFDTPSSKVWQTIMDEFLDVSKEELNEIVSQLKRNKYARLEILLRQPRSHMVVYSRISGDGVCVFCLIRNWISLIRNRVSLTRTWNNIVRNLHK